MNALGEAPEAAQASDAGALEQPNDPEALETEPAGVVVPFPAGQAETADPPAATPEIF